MSTTEDNALENAIPMEKIEIEAEKEAREEVKKKEKEKEKDTSSVEDAPIEEGEIIIDTPNSIAGNSVLISDKPRTMPHKKAKKKGEKKGFLKKKEQPGLAVRGEHLHRLIQTTKLNRYQILDISKKFSEFAPTGLMNTAEFKKALEFDANDPFAMRLFTIFEGDHKHSNVLTMDDFIIGLSKVAPEADINVKLDLCYELFDTDGNGNVLLSEFQQMTKYSMRHGKFGIDDEKLNKLIDSQWKQLEDGIVSRDEFKVVLRTQKAFVNALTLQVKWLQDSFRHRPVGAGDRDYFDNESAETLLFDVAQQLNAPEDQIKKWNDTLKRNLYFDVKSLHEIDSQDWTSMELPRRLYNAMRTTIDPNHQSNIIEGRVKHNVAVSHTLRDRIKIFIEFHKALIFFMILYIFGTGAMLTWTLVKYMTNHIGQKYHDQYQVLGTSFIVSRCAGALIKYNFALFIFPVCYRVITWMRSSMLELILPIDMAMNFHRRVGALILLLAIIHMCAHCVNFLRLSEANPAAINNAFGLGVTTAPSQASLHSTRTGITGWIMIACMLVLVAFAIKRVRRTNFKLFFSVHHLYIPIIICLVIHDGWLSPVEIIYWMAPVISVFLLERAFTVWRAVPTYESLEGTRILKGDVLALHIKKPDWFKYSSGHYLWINCPAVSKTEWHPFTLTSSPDEDYLMVDINCIGDWTKQLMNTYKDHLSEPFSSKEQYKRKGKIEKSPSIFAGVRPSTPPATPPPGGEGYSEEKLHDHKKDGHHAKEAEVMVPMKGQYLPSLRLDGPYGTASSDVLLYTHVLLVGGGIGVTPFISILKSIRYAVLFTNECPLHAVHFVWVTKNQENFQWFSMMLAELQRHEDLRGFLRVSIYLTGPRHPINDIRLLGVSLLMNKAKEIFNEDLVTGLEGQTHFGRPDFSKILLQHNQEWAGNDVGVFFCGPEPLAQTIRVTCRALNRANSLPIGKKVRKGARFYFKQEHF